MWRDLRRDLEGAVNELGLDEGHSLDDRQGRYSRALLTAPRIVLKADVIGWSEFIREDDHDICELIFWDQQAFEEDNGMPGRYLVVRMYYSRRNTAANVVGYREYVLGEIACYYDGEPPNGGAKIMDKAGAIETMNRSGRYHGS